MRGLQFAVSLLFSLLGLIGYLAFDYTMVSRSAKARGEEPISFVTYVSGLVQVAGLLGGGKDDGDGSGAAGAATSATLAAMLPEAPSGWIARPSEEGDVEPFLPPGAMEKDADKLRALVRPRSGRGLATAKVTYEKGARKVIIELVRHPDFIFTSFMAMQQKIELQMMSFDDYGRDFATVRGLEISESRLPEDFGGRLFSAQVGGQIHLRILASKAMTDEDLLPFLSTLDVPAMNADVVERTTGLGEVPLIVLASVLDAETRRTFEAERDAERQRRAEAQAARDAELEAAYEAERQREAEAARGITTDAETGIKVRKGTGKGSGSTFQTGSTLDGTACRNEDGRKICDAAEIPQDEE